MAHQLPSENWRVLIRRKGFPLESRVFGSEAEANLWERQRLAHLTRSGRASALVPTLAEVVRGYLKTTRFEDKAPGTQYRELCCAQSVLFLDPMPKGVLNRALRLADPNPLIETDRRARPIAGRGIDRIDGRDLQDHIDVRSKEMSHLTKKQISPDSVRLELRFLSAVFKFAVQQRYRESNPAIVRLSGLKMPTPRRRDTRISHAQEQEILSEAYARSWSSLRSNPSFFPWLELVRNTGCRPGEAAKIELAWVDLDKGIIDVPRRGTKKRNPRRVLLTARLVNILAPQLVRALTAGSPYLFFSHSRAGELVPYRYHSSWKAVARKAGSSCEAHGMRRELISRLFEDTLLGDGQVALLVGDVNPASLEPYRYLRSEKLRRHFEAFEAVQTKARRQADLDMDRGVLRKLKARGVKLTKEQIKAFSTGGQPFSPVDPVGDREVAEIAKSMQPVGAAARTRIDAARRRLRARRKKRSAKAG
jgi:integrase